MILKEMKEKGWDGSEDNEQVQWTWSGKKNYFSNSALESSFSIYNIMQVKLNIKNFICKQKHKTIC